MLKKFTAPAHLQPPTADWFCSVMDDFELEPHQVARDARSSFARLVAQLGLDGADEPKRGRGNPGYGGLGISYEQLADMAELPPRPKRKRRLRSK